MMSRSGGLPALAGIVAVLVLLGTNSMAQTGTESQVFSHCVTIKRPPEMVWNAIVTKAVVDTYYFVPLSADLTGVGQQFHYGPGDQQMIIGEVVEFQPPQVLKHSFRFGGDGQPDSVVTYSISPVGARTEVKVSHEGYAADSQPYADISGGWPIILDGLKAKLEAE